MSTVPWNNVQRILVACFGGIGAVVRSGPALRALHTALPETAITVISWPDGCQAATLLPWVDDVIECHIGGPDGWPADTRPVHRMIETIRRRSFDAALILTEAPHSPYVPAYMCYLAGIPIRIGQTREFGGSVLSHCITPAAAETSPVQRHLHLLEAAGIAHNGDHLELHVPEVLQLFTDQRLRTLGLIPDAPFAILALGVSADRKHDWAGVARNLTLKAGMPLVIMSREEHIVHELKQRCSALACIGRTSVSELAAIVRRAALIATDNADLVTIAEAFERHVVPISSYTDDNERSIQRPLATVDRHHYVVEETSTALGSDLRQERKDDRINATK